MAFSVGMAKLASVIERIEDPNSRKAIVLISELMAQVYSEFLSQAGQESDFARAPTLRCRALLKTSMLSQQIGAPTPQCSREGAENKKGVFVDVPKLDQHLFALQEETTDSVLTPMEEVTSSVVVPSQPKASANARRIAGMRATCYTETISPGHEVAMQGVLPNAWLPLPVAPRVVRHCSSPLDDADSMTQEETTRTAQALRTPFAAKTGQAVCPCDKELGDNILLHSAEPANCFLCGSTLSFLQRCECTKRGRRHIIRSAKAGRET